MLNNLAGILEARGAWEEADAVYRRAEAVAEARFGPDSLSVATLVNNRGFLAARIGDPAAAEDLFRRAVEIREAQPGEGTSGLATALDNLGTALFAQGRKAEARPLYDRAVAILAASPPDDGRDALYARAAVARMADGDVVGAFLVSQEIARGGAGSGLAASARRFAESDRVVRDLLRARQDLVARIDRLNEALSEAYGDPASARAEALIGEVAGAGQALRALDAQLGNRLGTARPAGVVTPEVAARDLRDGEVLVLAQAGFASETDAAIPGLVFALNSEGVLAGALLEGGDGYVEDARRLVCAAARRTDGLCAVQEAGAGAAVVALGAQTRGALRPRRTTPRGFDLALAHDLYGRLLGPIEDALEGAEHIVFVGVGALAEMPVHLLTTAPPADEAGAADFRSADWLLRRHAVTSLPEVSALRGLRGSGARGSAGAKAFLGIGDPVIGRAPAQSCADPMQMAAATRAGTDAATGDLLREGSVSVDGLSVRLAEPDAVRALTRLPDTRCELERIVETVGSGDLMLDAGATEGALKTLDDAGRLGDYRVISFATHGLRAGETGAEPALVLTPPSVATPRDDGLLTASEVAALDLDADWVILSACNTASAGAEDGQTLTGLAQAFFYAGARSLLVSRWPVVSPAAVRLTTEAFAAMDREPGLGRAQALRLAMLAVIDDPDSGPAELDPFYWAPFSLVGEGGAS
ncbi:MAG: CHAT domain-containing tetratricopeptide repeat protein [Pseudomonadota bacterium]